MATRRCVRSTRYAIRPMPAPRLRTTGIGSTETSAATILTAANSMALITTCEPRFEFCGGFDGYRHRQHVDIHVAAHRILFGGHDQCGVSIAGCGPDRRDIARRIPVVIWKQIG